jgi:hypothetical protein
MDEENVVYTYHGMLFSLTKERNLVICNMNGHEDTLLSEISQTHKRHSISYGQNLRKSGPEKQKVGWW